MFPSLPSILSFTTEKMSRYHHEADTARALRRAENREAEPATAPARVPRLPAVFRTAKVR